MIATLKIRKIELGHYGAQLESDAHALDEMQAHSIAALIRDAAKLTGIHAMHIWYHHVCIGTKTSEYMRDWAQILAQDLVDLERAIAE